MSENERHLIKKYANRKLYDTRISRYVTLESISELLREGAEIQVVDRETGRDITPVILSQIVTSEERRTDVAASGRAERGQQLLGYFRDALNVPAVLVGQEVERRRGDFETIVDVAIKQALTRLAIPSRREVERLTRRVDELEAKLGKLSGNGHGAGSERAAGRRRRAGRSSQAPAKG
jgi:polyhydroxyalkanoate synthesis repressor PhaR